MLNQILGVITLFVLVFGAPLIHGARYLITMHTKCSKEEYFKLLRNREA